MSVYWWMPRGMRVAASPHYSWRFVAKSLSRVARPARGDVRTRCVLVQYGEGPRGEPAGRRLVVAADRQLQQKRSWIMRVKWPHCAWCRSSGDSRRGTVLLAHPLAAVSSNRLLRDKSHARASNGRFGFPKAALWTERCRAVVAFRLNYR